MDVPEQAPPSPRPSPSRKRRNREMCHQCRHDKQRCEPQDRDWDKLEKCQRCQEYGYLCGPSERAPKKRKQKEQNAGLLSKNLPAARIGQPHNQNKEHATHKASLHEPSPAAKSQRPRPMTSFGVEASSNASASRPQSGICLDSTTTDISLGGDSARALRLLARLGDNLATKEMLTLELETVAHVRVWLQDTNLGLEKIRAVQAGLIGVKKRFDSYMQTARFWAEKDLQPGHEAFLLQVLLLKQKYENLSRSDCGCNAAYQHATNANVDEERIEDLLHGVQRRRGICSDAEYLYSSVRRTFISGPLKHTASSDAELVNSYSEAADAISRTMGDIVFEDFPVQQTLTQPWPGSSLPFPACHLSARQSNPSVIYELWNASRNRSKDRSKVWEKDILGRTPAHIAAYTGNLQALEPIFEATCVSTISNHIATTEMSSTAVIDTCTDVFGMTPLMITACRDDLEGFQLLLKYGASIQDLHNGRTVLDLAQQTRSKRVVQYISSSSLIADHSSPLRPNRQDAIEHLQRLDYDHDVLQQPPGFLPAHLDCGQFLDTDAEQHPPSLDWSNSPHDPTTILPYLEHDIPRHSPGRMIPEQMSSSTNWPPGQNFPSLSDFG